MARPLKPRADFTVDRKDMTRVLHVLEAHPERKARSQRGLKIQSAHDHLADAIGNLIDADSQRRKVKAKRRPASKRAGKPRVQKRAKPRPLSRASAHR